LSRRARRRSGRDRAGQQRAERAVRADRPSHEPGGRGLGLGAQIVLLIAIFAATVAIAELAGAANLGVALGVGQIVFAIALLFLLLRP